MARELKGPDISEFNGKVDFSALKSQCDFVILRCGYGSDYDFQDDTEFARNSRECEKFGIPYGVYLYSYAADKKAAVSEAEHVLRLIKGKKIDCGVWYDLEDAVLPENQDDLTDICMTFIDRIEKFGYKAGFYTNLYWIENRFDSGRIKNLKKWIAQWNSVLEYDGNCSIWQYSDSGRIAGIEGPVDMNRGFFSVDTAEPVKIVRVTPDIGLNIRRHAGTDSDIIRAVPHDTLLEIGKEKDGWGRLTEGGWVCMKYTEKISPKKYRVTPDVGLNIRSGPGTEFDILGGLSQGEKVKIAFKESGWGRIYGKKNQWVSMDFLERI